MKGFGIMRLNTRINSTLLSSALVCGLLGGLLVGQFFTARTMQVAQAASQERQLAAIQSARGAMNLIKYDMERAGYAEASPMSHASFRVSASAGLSDALQLTQATPRTLAFRSRDGRDTVEYRCEGVRLSRIATGKESEHVLLLANAMNFQIRQTGDGNTLNVAFAIPVGATSQSPVMAHFVRAAQ
jgi:hypothetical protein